MLDLYKNIRNRREELGMSQETLARKVGYTSRSTIARIEKGEIDISRSKILAFAQALKTTPSELMGWVDDAEKETFYPCGDFESLQPYEQEIMERIQLLSTGNQVAVLGIINQLIEAQEAIKNDSGTRKE